MRGVIRIAAGILGTAAAALIARELIRRSRRLEAQAESQRFAEEPIDAVLVVEDYVDISELYELNEMPGILPLEAQSLDDRAQAHGENWVEALQEQVIEYGTDPEAVLVFIDESESGPVSDTLDLPVADRGSGGPRGM